MNDILKVIQRYNLASSQWSAELQRAQMAGDTDATMTAMDQLADIEVRRNAVSAYAQRQQQQAVPQAPAMAMGDMELNYQDQQIAARYGLSPSEATIALQSWGDDHAGKLVDPKTHGHRWGPGQPDLRRKVPDMTTEEKFQSYANNKVKLAALRRSGNYDEAKR